MFGFCLTGIGRPPTGYAALMTTPLATAEPAAPPTTPLRTAARLALSAALVFPGNIAQFVNKRDGFGLDTDAKR